MSKPKALLLGLALTALAAGGCTTFAPVDVTGAKGAGAKQGEACVSNILGIVATGNAAVHKAAKNGGISKVSTVDYKFNSGIFKSEVCTVVTGK